MKKQNILFLAGLLCLASCSQKEKNAEPDTYKSLRN